MLKTNRVRNLLSLLAGLTLVGVSAYPRTASAFTDVFCDHPNHTGTDHDDDDRTTFPAMPATVGQCTVSGASCWIGGNFNDSNSRTYSQLQVRTCKLSTLKPRREIRVYAQGPLADYAATYPGATEYAAKALRVDGTELVFSVADDNANGVWSDWLIVNSDTSATSTVRVVAWVAGP